MSRPGSVLAGGFRFPYFRVAWGLVRAWVSHRGGRVVDWRQVIEDVEDTGRADFSGKSVTGGRELPQAALDGLCRKANRR